MRELLGFCRLKIKQNYLKNTKMEPPEGRLHRVFVRSSLPYCRNVLIHSKTSGVSTRAE